MSFSFAARGDTKAAALDAVAIEVERNPYTPKGGHIERIAALCVEDVGNDHAVSFSIHGHANDGKLRSFGIAFSHVTPVAI